MVKTLAAGLPLQVAVAIVALIASGLASAQATVDEVERELGGADAF